MDLAKDPVRNPFQATRPTNCRTIVSIVPAPGQAPLGPSDASEERVAIYPARQFAGQAPAVTFGDSSHRRSLGGGHASTRIEVSHIA